jgi:hypothetical protein
MTIIPAALNTEAERNKRNKQRSGGKGIERHGAWFFQKNNSIGRARDSRVDERLFISR